jgi:BlaI family transcriptional regulator, penicillinase repressor
VSGGPTGPPLFLFVAFPANPMTKIFVDNDEVLRHTDAMASKPPRPTEAELSILRVLWERGAQSVREVQRTLNETRPTGYTTVLKLLQIMTEKGLVERDESTRPQIYTPRYSKQQTQRQLVGDLLHRAFGGSVKALVLQALSTKKSSPEELEAIEKLLDRIEGEKK